VFQKNKKNDNYENCDENNEGGVAVRSLERIPTSMSGVGNGYRQQNNTKLAGTMSPSLKH
jgi:hypothetical protein